MADLRKLGSWFRMAFGPERTSTTGALVAQLVELATLARKEGMLAAGEPGPRRRGPVPAPRPAAGHRRRAGRAAPARARARDRGHPGRRPGRGPLLRQDGRLRADRRHHRHRRRAGAGAQEPRGPGGARPARRRRLRRDPVGRAVGELRLAADEREDPPERRPPPGRRWSSCVEGICEILAGTNPRAIREKLRAMLPPSEAQLSAA